MTSLADVKSKGHTSLAGLLTTSALVLSGCMGAPDSSPPRDTKQDQQTNRSVAASSEPAAAPAARLAQESVGATVGIRGTDTAPRAYRHPPAVTIGQRGTGFVPGTYPQPAATYPGVERFPDKPPSGGVSVAEQPVSTFSLDVDTASYAYVRRILTGGGAPPAEAVRVEEMVNYFRYAYPAPDDRGTPFRVTTSVLPNPWDSAKQLLHIAVRGYDIPRRERPRANLVLLIDVSGSMGPADRLPLLQQAFRLFAAQLRDEDRVSIVTYAGHAQVALEPTPGAQRERIIDAIDALGSGGSTAGADGLQQAYRLAERNFDPEVVNRVILATDGDFNVGISDPRALEKFIATKRKTGVYLSIFGVGLGNLNDALMQRLAQAGNGNAAYLDSLLEARKALAEELGSTLFPIANDVKVQVEFNPARVSAYRLVGYETRALRREDFNDDRIDAGDIGAGHTVTAIYEITPADGALPYVDPLRYRGEPAVTRGRAASHPDEIAFVKLRYKLPGQSQSRLLEQPVGKAQVVASLGGASTEQRFGVAVAAFAQRLRGETALESFGYGAIADLANGARGRDPDGYRAEFVKLVRTAEAMGAVSLR